MESFDLILRVRGREELLSRRLGMEGAWASRASKGSDRFVWGVERASNDRISATDLASSSGMSLGSSSPGCGNPCAGIMYY